MANVWGGIRKSLTEKNIRILIDHIDLKSFGEILSGHSQVLEKWAKIFLSMGARDICWLRNFALATARFLIDHNAELAINLFEALKSMDSFVTISMGDGLTFEHQAVWSCPPSDYAHKLWDSRIKASQDDAELFLEVLAAERYGASLFIREYVKKSKESEEALNIRYAITIARFSSQYEHMKTFLDGYESSISHVGNTAKKAHENYMRANWSEHWFQKMHDAESQEEFWLAMKLTVRVADARLSINQTACSIDDTWACYQPIFSKERQKRINKCQTKRKKTLLGTEVPTPIFLSVDSQKT
jgi:hypothetical protein